MVPSFAASSMLVYEWFQDQQETRLLIYAILCLIVGVVGGMFTVHLSQSVENEKARKNASSILTMEEEMAEFQQAKILDAADIGWSSGFGETVPEAVLSAVQDVPALAKNEIPAIDKALLGADKDQALRSEKVCIDKEAADKIIAESAAGAKIVGEKIIEKVVGSQSVADKAVERVAEKVTEKSVNEKSVSEKTAVRAASASSVSVPISGTTSGGHVIALGPTTPVAGEVIAMGASNEPGIGEPPALDFSPAPSSTANPQPPSSISPEFAFLADAGDARNDAGAGTVERAQAVVARLEAEVAKAEVVAAKLESELAKAEPVAAMLSGESNHESSGTVNFAFVLPVAAAATGAADEVRQLPEFERAEDWLAYAAQLVHDQNFDDAIKCYDKVTALDSKNFDGWYFKSVALRRKGRGEDAIYCVNYALSLRSDDSRALSEKGECLLQMNKNEQALTWFEKAISADEKNARAWCGKARSLAAVNKHKEAIQSYERVLSLDPNNEEAKKAKVESSKKVGSV